MTANSHNLILLCTFRQIVLTLITTTVIKLMMTVFWRRFCATKRSANCVLFIKISSTTFFIKWTFKWLNDQRSKPKAKKYLRKAAEAQTMFLKLNRAEVHKKVTEKLRKILQTLNKNQTSIEKRKEKQTIPLSWNHPTTLSSLLAHP